MTALGRASAADPRVLVKREALASEAVVPPAFLDDILRALRAGTLVTSQRGSSGGWRLAKAAKDITVADIIRALEGPLASVRGIRPHDLPRAGVHDDAMIKLWIATRESLRSVLEHVSVADLVSGKLPKDVAEIAKRPGAWDVH